MVAAAQSASQIFAGNRAVGGVAFSVVAGPGEPGSSRRARVHEAGSLRVRFPNVDRHSALDAVIINTAGGMAGGDRFDIDVKIGPGARLALTSAAAEKVYRALGPDTEIGIKLDIAPGSVLNWLPQETILFDRARMRRSTEVTMAPGARLLLAEAVVFGRSAMGESVESGCFVDRRRVRLGGKLLFAETVRLDGQIAQSLARRAVAGQGNAIASVLKVPGNDADVAAVRALAHDFAGEADASAWNGIVVARLVAPSDGALRRDLAGVLRALGAAPLPRLWLN